MRQTPHCGVHVHVGMPDGETAIRACQRHARLDSAAAGAGRELAVPVRARLRPRQRAFGDLQLAAALRRSRACSPTTPTTRRPWRSCAALGEFPDDSYLWWDLRPHPRFGTLEIRALDAQSSLEDLVALVALIHCLAVHEASAPPRRLPGPEALRELSFRATRDGLDARLWIEGGLRPVRDVALHAVAIASAYAADLGCWEELMLVHRLIERGNGAARQRANAVEGGVELMLQRAVEETTAQEAVAIAG